MRRGMACPHCKIFDTKVVDSRPTWMGAAIRRRRECSACERRWTTIEHDIHAPSLSGHSATVALSAILRAEGMVTDLRKLLGGVK